MSRPVEQALTNLIPRHSEPLPAQLVELASSLLAQSRNKCSNLKAEEEIARVFACANLACERLKTTLNLPPIEPRPPIPPRVYSKLYTYFDRELTSALPSRPRGRPPKSASKNTPTKSLPHRHTPVKEKSLEGYRVNRTPRKGLKFSSKAERDEQVPRWLGPVIRLLCRELATPLAMPHILAGVETLLCSPRPSSSTTPSLHGIETEKPDGKLPALIAAVWFFVVVKMSGGEIQQDSLQRKKLVLEVLGRARDDAVLAAKIGDTDGDWKGWELVEERDVNMWRKEIVGHGWREMDWFENITEGGGVFAGDDGSEEDDSDDDEVQAARLRREDRGSARGPGTMIQNRYDYLSPARRKAYVAWRDKILAAIDGLIADEAAGQDGDKMDTAEG